MYWSLKCCIFNHLGFFSRQILAVEILQHRFNMEKMVKVSEILRTYSEDVGSLQVPIMNILPLKQLPQLFTPLRSSIKLLLCKFCRESLNSYISLVILFLYFNRQVWILWRSNVR